MFCEHLDHLFVLHSKNQPAKTRLYLQESTVTNSRGPLSCEPGGHLDAVDPQHRLRVDDDLLALEPVSLPELHVNFGPGLGLLDDGGVDPDQLLAQQRPPYQGELLRADQQHLLHPDLLPALRLDVILDQDQILVGHLPLMSGEMHHSKQAAEVSLVDLLVHGVDHLRVPPPLLLLRDRDHLIRPRWPRKRRLGNQAAANGALCSSADGEREALFL